LKTAYAVHPGVVATNLARNLGPVLAPLLASIGPPFLKSVGEGAATEVFAAVSPKALPLASNYLADSNVKKPRADAEDAALATPTSLQIGRVGSERARAWVAFARWWNRLRLIDRRRDHRGHRHRIARAAPQARRPRPNHDRGRAQLQPLVRQRC